MNTNKDSSLGKAPLHRRILGSALSAFVGWFVPNLALFVGACLRRIIHPEPMAYPHDWLLGPTFIAVYSAAFVFATWLLALVPLYLLVPLRSVLWRWPVCTLCGALAGALIMAAFLAPPPYDRQFSVLILLAAFTGAITCLFGSLSVNRFHQAPASTNTGLPFSRH